MKRNILNSPRLSELKKRRRRRFLNKVLIFLFLLGIGLTLLAYFSRLPGINIETIEVRGNSIVSAEAIQAGAEAQLTGKYFWLFPKTNVLFYPKSKIKKSLAAEYQRLGEIVLSVQDNRILIISVTEREPLFTWCGVDWPASEGEQCYFLDRAGYIFDIAPYFSGEVYFKFYGSAGVQTTDPIGSYFAREHFLNFILFKETLTALELKPVVLWLKDDGDAEIFLSRSSDDKPKIIIQANTDMENLAENLSAALETEPLKTRIEKEYSKLEYLDLRFDDKVYSKFK